MDDAVPIDGSGQVHGPFAGVAQVEERRFRTAKVGVSIISAGSSFAALAQME